MSDTTAAAVGREVELKLELAERELPRVTRHPPLLALATGPARRQRLRSVYYDTSDLALWRSGLVLRIRAVGRRRIVGVKTRGTARAGLVARAEHERPLVEAVEDLRRVPARALLGSIEDRHLRRAVEKAAAGRRLGPRVETEFRRTTLPLRSGGARLELALDQGEVRAGRRRVPLAEIELELLSGAPHALFDVALALARGFDVHPSPLGKAERGFLRLLHEGTEPSRAEAVALGPHASLESALRAVLREGVRHLTGNQLAAARGAPEGVHQMRVAARRLRSALRLFEDWLPARATEALADELRWLARELGHARDLDVFALELLEPIAERQAAADGELATLRTTTDGARTEARRSVHAALDSPRYTQLALQLGRLAEAPLPRVWRAALDAPARRALRPLLRKRAAKLQELGERLDALTPPELHRLRIRAKRLRYALELVGPLVDGRHALRSARRLAELQDALGHLNDLTNAEAQLAALRERLGAAAQRTARAEGFVLGYAARSAAAGRETLGKVWRRAARLGPLGKAGR